METKICTKCKKEKPISEFFKRHKAGKPHEQCKTCMLEYRKTYETNNQDKVKKWRKTGYDKTGWLEELNRKFGDGASTFYLEKFEQQNGHCAICGRPQSKFKRRFSLDHVHETGKWRGLLCMDCNIMLGKAGDSIVVLKEAANYLDKNKLEIV